MKKLILCLCVALLPLQLVGLTIGEGEVVKGDLKFEGSILLIQGKIEGNVETETADVIISGVVEGNVKHKGLDDQDNDRDIYIYDTGVVYGDVITNDSDVELIGEVRGNIVTNRGNVDVWSQNANRRRVRNREIDRGTCRGSITTNHGDIDISEGEVHGSIKTNSGNVEIYHNTVVRGGVQSNSGLIVLTKPYIIQGNVSGRQMEGEYYFENEKKNKENAVQEQAHQDLNKNNKLIKKFKSNYR